MPVKGQPVLQKRDHVPDVVGGILRKINDLRHHLDTNIAVKRQHMKKVVRDVGIDHHHVPRPHTDPLAGNPHRRFARLQGKQKFNIVVVMRDMMQYVPCLFEMEIQTLNRKLSPVRKRFFLFRKGVCHFSPALSRSAHPVFLLSAIKFTIVIPL